MDDEATSSCSRSSIVTTEPTEARIPDTETNVESIRALYELDGDMTGPFTTPVLWDKKENTIVNNESMEILQILNSGFHGIANDADFKNIVGNYSDKEASWGILT